ncbi:MAG: sodium:proton antiporter [Thermoprotei archaeon]
MDHFVWNLAVFAIIATLCISIYGIVKKPNLVKKLIALTILSDTVNLMVILVGYRVIYPVMPPVLPIRRSDFLEYFVSHAVDPLPQAFVLTAVVISMAVNCLIAFAIIQIYRLYGTADARRIVEIAFPEERL